MLLNSHLALAISGLLVLFAVVVCGAVPGPSSMYVGLSLTGAGWWSGWVDVPIWLMLLASGFLVMSSVRSEELLFELIRIPKVGKSLSLALLGVVIGYPLMQGFASIVDSQRASSFGIRQRDMFNTKGRPFLKVRLGIRQLVGQILFRIEVLILILAEYVTRSGKQIVKNQTQELNDFTIKAPKKSIRLYEIYEFDDFSLFYEMANADFRLCQEWNDAIRSYIHPGQRVLEIGSGMGQLGPIVKSLGARYTGVEQNESLFNYSMNQYGKNYIHGFWPDYSISEKYHVILMHKNVFIELVNASDEDHIISYLFNIIEDDGILIFDYPEIMGKLPYDEYVSVLNLKKGDGTSVAYGYTPVKCEDDRNCADLRIEWQFPGGKRSISSTRLEFSIPPLKGIVDLAERHGLELVLLSDCSISTFYPARMSLVILSNKHHSKLLRRAEGWKMAH
jgi:hypothetical protein